MRRPMPLIGYRLWLADSTDLTLSSLTFDDLVWTPGAAMGASKRPSEPALYGGHGFHAMTNFFHADPQTARFADSYSLWHTISKLKERSRGQTGKHWVAGAVLAWGEVALHDCGVIRAEFMRPMALHYQPSVRDPQEEPPFHLQLLADKYHLPLFWEPASLTAYAAEWGQPVSTEMLGAA